MKKMDVFTQNSRCKRVFYAYDSGALTGNL